jgi:hypothetical protein
MSTSIKIPKWVVNLSKYERARTKAGADATEEQVKEVYENMAGLVREQGDNSKKSK